MPAPAASTKPRSRSRAAQAARWAGLVLTLLIVALMAASLRWQFRAWHVSPLAGDQRSSALAVESLGLRFWTYKLGHTSPIPAWNAMATSPIQRRLLWWPTVDGAWGRAWEIDIPLWMPLIIAAFPSALLWRSEFKARRRPGLGCCPKCGYDLSGLLSLAPTRVCPECGTTHQHDEPQARDG